MIKSTIAIKTIIKPNAPTQFKKEVARLLNDLMKDYNIKGRDKEMEDGFKGIFKSNLYYVIDNYFEVKKK